MILLLGGTSDAKPIAQALAQAGQGVLVSLATDEPLDVGDHPNIRRRSGPMDAAALGALVGQENITAIVDATHPYAVGIRSTASGVAARLGVPYFSYVRDGRQQGPSGRIHVVADHEEAAAAAFSFGRAVLLTTGSRHLACYVEQSRQAGVALIARVLPRSDSLEACRAAGIDPAHVIAAKGPFSVEQNREHIRQFGIGVLVTKDSGEAGGGPAKLEAAEREGSQTVLIGRPSLPGEGLTSVPDLVRSVLTACSWRSL